MGIDHLANEDFERATLKAFWRRIGNWFTGTKNELLPFDEVRRNLPLRGQRYIGMRTVPIDKIVGSAGRYLDFDRSFLPIQSHTKDRWISIDKAHIQQVDLPPVELYKIGEIYFVKDGNHRISVARERGQQEIDAFVIELDVPIQITSELTMENLELKKAYAIFMEETGLFQHKPQLVINAANPDTYETLREHIAAHRWFLGEQQKMEIDNHEAALSWYLNVYQPLIKAIHDQGIQRKFSQVYEADLYVWIMDYQWFLRQPFEDTDEILDADQVREEAAKKLISSEKGKLIQRLAGALRKADWVEKMVLNQESALFFEKVGISGSEPEFRVECVQPWNYRRLLEHITVHRWFLGEERKQEVSLREAFVSWYERVYMPIVTIIRESKILMSQADVAEGDLYLWVVARKYVFTEPDLDSLSDTAA